MLSVSFHSPTIQHKHSKQYFHVKLHFMRLRLSVINFCYVVSGKFGPFLLYNLHYISFSASQYRFFYLKISSTYLCLFFSLCFLFVSLFLPPIYLSPSFLSIDLSFLCFFLHLLSTPPPAILFLFISLFISLPRPPFLFFPPLCLFVS